MLLVVRIEAVVTDLDGTVVRSDFSISPATLEALDLIRSAGIAFVIATARTPQGLEHFQVLASEPPWRCAAPVRSGGRHARKRLHGWT